MLKRVCIAGTGRICSLVLSLLLLSALTVGCSTLGDDRISNSIATSTPLATPTSEFIIPTGVIPPTTPFPFPPPTPLPDAIYEPTQVARFERVLTTYGVDLNYDPPRWRDIRLGVTDINTVVREASGFGGDVAAPRRRFAFEDSGLRVAIYSDSALPTPKLRALMFTFPYFRTTVAPSQERWLPKNLLTRAMPRSVMLQNSPVPVGAIGGHSIHLHFENWSVTYGATNTRLNGGEHICMKTLPLPAITIWAYTSAEVDFDSMLKDLSTYQNTYPVNAEPSKGQHQVTFTEPSEIAAVVTFLRSDGCVEATKIDALVPR